ncbi:MAG: hypothetical protein U1F66_06485 [bacterium]
MNRSLPFFLALAATLGFSALHAETTKTTNVENGVQTTHIYRSDDPAVGDPVGNRGVSARDDKGPANTQKFCEEGSSDPDCSRAEKRQTSKTTWQEDCASGATKACSK